LAPIRATSTRSGSSRRATRWRWCRRMLRAGPSCSQAP
jgi:hypothetical protein